MDSNSQTPRQETPTLRMKEIYKDTADIFGMIPRDSKRDDDCLLEGSSSTLNHVENKRKVPPLKINERYNDIPDITGLVPRDSKWDDECLLEGSSIILKHLENEELLKEIKIFVYGLAQKMSDRAAAAALILTWNMKRENATCRRMFPDRDSGSSADDVDAKALESTDTTYFDEHEQLSYYYRLNPNEVIKAGTFLAASTLKMFSKPALSFQERYKKDFNNNGFILNFIKPTARNVESLEHAFKNRKLMITTLGRILYAVGGMNNTSQIDMLFVNDLKYTGMHIVPQFVRAVENLEATCEELLCALDCGSNTRSLTQLRDLINESLSKEIGEGNRGGWRFARIFKNTAFGFLQTKFCQDTVVILVHLNQMYANGNESGDPMKIAAIRQMPAAEKERFKMVAKNIHRYFTSRNKSVSEENEGE